jgi:hypothetical protein
MGGRSIGGRSTEVVPKILIWVTYLYFTYGHLVYFMAIWYILWPFGIFYGHLVYFMAIRYILWPFGIFYGHLVYFEVIRYIFHALVWKIWRPKVKVLYVSIEWKLQPGNNNNGDNCWRQIWKKMKIFSPQAENNVKGLTHMYVYIMKLGFYFRPRGQGVT